MKKEESTHLFHLILFEARLIAVTQDIKFIIYSQLAPNTKQNPFHFTSLTNLHENTTLREEASHVSDASILVSLPCNQSPGNNHKFNTPALFNEGLWVFGD